MTIETLKTLVAAELAQRIHCATRTVVNNQSRAPHLLPPFRKVGRRAIWLEQDVIQWLRERETGVPPKAPDPLAPMILKRSPGRPRKTQKSGDEK